MPLGRWNRSAKAHKGHQCEQPHPFAMWGGSSQSIQQVHGRVLWGLSLLKWQKSRRSCASPPHKAQKGSYETWSGGHADMSPPGSAAAALPFRSFFTHLPAFPRTL
jgi:hypothetical protein